MSSIEEALQTYRIEDLNTSKIMERGDLLLFGDGSTSAPNIRGIEVLMNAVLVNKLNMPILSTVYPADRIGNVLRGTPFKLGIVIPEEYAEYFTGVVPPIDECTLVLNESLVRQYYADLFGDPIESVNNKFRRAKDKGTAPEEIYNRMIGFISDLPASLFTLPDGTTYLNAVIGDRKQMIVQTSLALYGTDCSPNVEMASDHLGSLTLGDLLACEPSLANQQAMSFTCAECTLNSTEGTVAHIVTFDGHAYKNAGSRTNQTPPKCKTMKNVNELGEEMLNISLQSLLMAGLKMSGKAIYLAESQVFQNPNIIQGIRDYSDPRGTVAMAIRNWTGLDIVTPRTYMRSLGDDGQLLDVSGYELMQFMQDPNNLVKLRQFADQVPVVTDGQTHAFLI